MKKAVRHSDDTNRSDQTKIELTIAATHQRFCCTPQSCFYRAATIAHSPVEVKP